jgi:DNA (cytosine-5)-methyltransferase 1
MKIYFIDLFCGAGGTSTGIHLANENTTVLACVNHDKNAIESHRQNHPTAHHFTEDIRDFNVVLKLKKLVDELRLKEPNAIISIWASLECTNFSNAKGGQARDADSRTLAEHMFMYLYSIDPDYFWVENVREFMAWGPLDQNNKPISRGKGTDFIKWVDNVKNYGYDYDHKILNAADYGAYQSRERLFMQFAKSTLPIVWPMQTHIKEKYFTKGGDLLKWKPVSEVLELENEGVSIFERKKPLSENTLKRIYAGLTKFVANGDKAFMKRYNGGNPKDKVKGLDHPCGTISTNGRHAIVTASHLNTYYGNSGLHSIDNPSPTVTTKDRIAKVDVNFIDQQYGKSIPIGINQPCNSLTTVPKFALIKAKKFILNPAWGGNNGSIEKPCCTVVARQDKAPLYVVSAQTGVIEIQVYKDDSETMILIKNFMVEYGIIDIKMRMLNIPELKQIQGFSKEYILTGTLTQQKKAIGNAVEVGQALVLIKTSSKAILKYKLKLAS